MSTPFVLRTINAAAFNEWQTKRHYLKRPIIQSKMLAHGLFIDNELVGGLLWATPHFTKKSGLFGMGGDTLDKWEVLMLGRFYLVDGCGIVASTALAESIGRGRNRGSHRRGWRLQEDWVTAHPPRFPDNPFVPRMLISWSDTQWGHNGTIYRASGWELWDETKSGGTRTGRAHWSGQTADVPRVMDGDKRCWIMRLGPNPRAEQLGRETAYQQGVLYGTV